MSNSPDVDRGWAFVVLFGYFFNRFMVPGMSLSPGILYDNLLDYFGESRALTAWAINFNSFVMYVSGSFSSAFLKVCGARVTMTIGCLVSSVGFFATAFAPNLICVSVFYGIVTGLGFSLMSISCYPVITKYFVNYRDTAIHFAGCGIGVGQFVIPYLFYWLTNAYSWQGALIVIAIINLNFLVVAASFMTPRIEFENIEKGNPERSNDMLSTPSTTKDCSIAVRVASCLKTSILDDLVLFHDYCFVLIMFRYLFSSLGVVGLMTHAKAFGLQNGLTDIEATTLLSFLGLFKVVGTIAITFLLQNRRVNFLVLNFVFTLCIGVITILLCIVQSKISYFIIVGIIGFFTGSVASFPVVILIIVGEKYFAAGVGYASISIGIGCVMGGSIGAALQAVDSTYISSFATLGIFCILGSLLQIPIILAIK